MTTRAVAALAAAFFFSGAAGLIYQVVWGRLLVLVFGSTTIAVSTVLTVFMGGLALGAWLGGRWIDRIRRPLVVYAVIEAFIALSALGVPWMLDQAAPVSRTLWTQWSTVPVVWLGVRFTMIALILGVPTLLMGATLPVMSRALADGRGALSERVAAFYALNTAGAIAGAATTGFLWLPTIGVSPTLGVAAGCNVVAGLAAWAIGRSQPNTAPPVEPPGAVSLRDLRTVRWVAVTLAVSGAAALVNEVAWSRALSLVLGSSVYAFAAMLTTFLLGLAAGAASGVRLTRRLTTGLGGLGGLQIGIGLACLVTVGLLSALPMALIAVVQQLEVLGPRAVPIVQFVLAFAVMALPAYGFGMVLPAAIHCLVGDPRTVGASVGRLYAVNTAGAILGAFMAGFVLVPLLGLQPTLIAAAGACLVLGLGLIWADRAASPARVLGVTAGVVLAMGLAWVIIPTWSATLMSSGVYWNLARYLALAERRGAEGVQRELQAGRIVYEREGLTATVVVSRDADGARLLTINGRTESGDPFMRTQVAIAHWPLWFARDLRAVLVIGMGSGSTAGSMLRYPVGRLDVVELEPAVIEASHQFEPENGRPLADARTHVRADDGRNFLLMSTERYDVIVSQPSLPWVAGAATLFTEDFFQIAAARLAPGGVLGQWVTADAMGPEDVRSVFAAFARVFPHFLVIEPTPGDVFILGSHTPLALEAGRLSAALTDPVLADDLKRVDIVQPSDLAAMLIGTDASIRPLLSGAIPNRDENVAVEFSGPLAFADIVAGRRRDSLAWLTREPMVRTWNTLLTGAAP